MEQRRRIRKRAPGSGPAIDWTRLDDVVGTRDDLTRTGINWPCTRCAEPVFTSRRYPVAVARICEVCALDLVEEERLVQEKAAGAPAVIRRHEPLPDPWQRSAGVAPRRPGPRKVRWPPPSATPVGGDTQRAVDASGGPPDPQARQESRAEAQSVRALLSHDPRR